MKTRTCIGKCGKTKSLNAFYKRYRTSRKGVEYCYHEGKYRMCMNDERREHYKKRPRRRCPVASPDLNLPSGDKSDE